MQPRGSLVDSTNLRTGMVLNLNPCVNIALDDFKPECDAQGFVHDSSCLNVMCFRDGTLARMHEWTGSWSFSTLAIIPIGSSQRLSRQLGKASFVRFQYSWIMPWLVAAHSSTRFAHVYHSQLPRSRRPPTRDQPALEGGNARYRIQDCNLRFPYSCNLLQSVPSNQPSNYMP